MYIHPNRVKRKTDRVLIERSAFVALLLIGIMLFVNLGRVAYIMITKGDEYRQTAASNQLYDVSIEGIRGTIYDSNMTPLATSTTAWILCANPKEIKRKFDASKILSQEGRYEKFVDDLSKKLAKILGEKKKDIKEKLLQNELSYQKHYS